MSYTQLQARSPWGCLSFYKKRQILAGTRLTRDQRQLSGHPTRSALAKTCWHRHNSIVVSPRPRAQPIALRCDFKFLFDQLNASIIRARRHLNQDSCARVAEVDRRDFASNRRMALTSISSCSCADKRKQRFFLITVWIDCARRSGYSDHRRSAMSVVPVHWSGVARNKWRTGLSCSSGFALA